MKEVLFLDFDGPLFSDRYIRFDPDQVKPYPGRIEMPDVVTYWKMDPMAVYMMNFLHDLHSFETVVSSSWRKFINREQCEDLFIANGLNLHLADDWMTIEYKSSDHYGRHVGQDYRAVEIREYINRKGVEEYLILDDPWSGSSLDEKDNELVEQRIVMVDPDVGIGSHDYLKMLNVVKHWAGIVKPLW